LKILFHVAPGNDVMLESALTIVDRRTCHRTFRRAIDCHLMTSLYIIVINVIIDTVATAAPLDETFFANGLHFS
jgi:hypothetical protein